MSAFIWSWLLQNNIEYSRYLSSSQEFPVKACNHRRKSYRDDRVNLIHVRARSLWCACRSQLVHTSFNAPVIWLITGFIICDVWCSIHSGTIHVNSQYIHVPGRFSISRWFILPVKYIIFVHVVYPVLKMKLKMLLNLYCTSWIWLFVSEYFIIHFKFPSAIVVQFTSIHCW